MHTRNDNNRLFDSVFYDQLEQWPHPQALACAQLYFRMTLNEPCDARGPKHIIFPMMKYVETVYSHCMALKHELQ